MKLNWIKYLNFFLLIVVVLLLVNTFFFLKSYGKEQEEDIAPLPSMSQDFSEPQKRMGDYAVIYRRDLFNMKEAPKPMSRQAPVSLKLKGTVIGTEEFTFCIIEDKTKRQENLYQKGDKINGMEITDITVNSVVLDNGSMVLYIDEEAGTKGDEVASVPVAPEEDYFGLIDVEQSSPNEWVVSREDFLEATNNISQILSDFKIKPNFSSGKMDGFKIDDIKDDSFTFAVGIEKGDIVKKINGEMIDSPKKIFEFYRGLSGTDAVELEIERNGKTEVLTYKIKP